jgi:endogenous inhibitor of DNA gyrase (YacG/DUF329 family)
VQRNCNECGTAYQAQRPTSKFCSTRCRTRQTRKRQSGEPVIPAVPRIAPALPTAETGQLTDATRAELGDLAETADGILLLTLAARIDAVPETSPALATLSKEFAARKADAMSRVSRIADPMDELKARRDRRRAV